MNGGYTGSSMGRYTYSLRLCSEWHRSYIQSYTEGWPLNLPSESRSRTPRVSRHCPPQKGNTTNLNPISYITKETNGKNNTYDTWNGAVYGGRAKNTADSQSQL